MTNRDELLHQMLEDGLRPYLERHRRDQQLDLWGPIVVGGAFIIAIVLLMIF